MSGEPMDLVREGLDAWRTGDLDAIRSLLDPAATWRWWEPGEWDCENRDDVLRTLRERYEQGFGRAEYELVEGAGDTVVVVSHPSAIAGEDWPDEAATVISFRGRTIVSMQDFVSREEALAAVRP